MKIAQRFNAGKRGPNFRSPVGTVETGLHHPPDISRVVFDVVLVQELRKLLLIRFVAVVLFLIGDVKMQVN